MNTCTRYIEFAKQSTVALALWVSIYIYSRIILCLIRKAIDKGLELLPC